MCSESDRKTRILQRFCTATVVAASLVWVCTASTAIEAQELSPEDKLRNAFRPRGETQEAQPPNPAASGLQPLSSVPLSSVPLSSVPLSSANKSLPRPVVGFGTAPFDLSILQPLFEASQLVEGKNSPGLRQLAEESFLAGNQSRALQLMFGHMAAEYEEAADSILAVKYSSLLKRPVWNVRFGISMWVRNGGPEEIDPSPIPADGDARNQSQGQRRLEALVPLSKTGGDNDPKADTETAADELSGEAATSLAQTTAIPADDDTMLSEVANEELDRNLGLVAQVIAEEFDTRYRGGDFGRLLIDVKSTEPVTSSPVPVPVLGLQANPSDPPSKVNKSAPDSLRMWQPGIVYLGNAVTKEILEKATAADIDLVIHIEVVLKPGRNDSAQNISRVRLINVSTGKSVGVSKSIDSYEESQLKAKGNGGREYVNEKLENLLSILDRDAKVVDLPKLTPEVARRRLSVLLGSEPERSLRTLAEIRLYQKQQLLKLEEVETAFQIVGGNDSLMLLYGLTEERTEMVLKWAAKRLSPAVNR